MRVRVRRTPSLLAAAGVLSLGLAMGLAPQAATAEELIIVEIMPLSHDLAGHLRVGVDKLPPSVDLSDKNAAVVCQSTLKQLRESRGGGPKGRCVAVNMSQGLIQAVRQAMRGG